MRSFTWIWAALTLVSGTEYGAPRCKIYEFECRGGNKCISGELFCDGRDQCGDRSDEPLGCTPCNRTYYGEVGRSYRLSIPRPRANKLPLICDLHFVAKHEEHGDLIQLTFEEFKLGRFRDSHTSGCPDGYLKLLDGYTPRDLRRLTEKGEGGGEFCGSVSKSVRPIYFSEKSELTAALRFFKFYNGETPDRSFAFRIKYKFLQLSRAHSRYGDLQTESTSHSTRGGNCHINLTDCSRRTCHLRSPNYPGIYPRNSSCNYRIVLSPNEIPQGKVALISVSQPHHFKTHILTSPKKKNSGHLLGDTGSGVKESGYLFFGRRKEEGGLGLFEECRDDSVTIHDGIYTTDPILISFCRGDIIPPIVSSSDSGMLIVFRSSPFGVPDMEPFTLNGFDLRVNVIFKNQASIIAAPIKEECRFTIRSGLSPPSGVQEGSLKSGVIENVIHRLVSAKNQSCFYEFHGNPDEVLWITFLKFKVVYDRKKNHRQNPHDCVHRISLQDNIDHSTFLSPTNTSLSATFCESNPPSICDHDYLQFNHHTKKFHFRTCWRHWNESYVSRSSKLMLVESLSHLHSGSSLNFKFRYEFVDVGQGGSATKRDRKVHFTNEHRSREPVIHRSPILHRDSLSKPAPESWIHTDRSSRIIYSNNNYMSNSQMDKAYASGSFPTCHRVFTSNATSRKRKKRFFSTKNVFFFGRGSGRKELQCSYTFKGRPGERILLRIKRMNLFNQETCRTVPDPYGTIDHFVCQRNSTRGTISEIQISEVPDQKGITLCQFCLCGTGQGNFLSNTSTLRLDLIISGMTPFTDYSQFLVEGSYEFIHEPVCRLTKIISGQPSGVIEFNDRPDCERQPWVIKPYLPRHFLYLRIPGYVMIEPDSCSHTNNRLIIHRTSMESLVICPSNLHFLELFSTGWEDEDFDEEDLPQEGASVVIESSVKSREQMEDIRIVWLEVWKPKEAGVPQRNSALKIESLSSVGLQVEESEEDSYEQCTEFCPEINGCISPLLWCDGEAHCPSSGSDESEEHCSHVLLPSMYYYGLSSLLGILAFIFTILLLYRTHIWWSSRIKDSDITVISSGGSRVRRSMTHGIEESSLTNISGTIETTVFSGHHHHPFILEGVPGEEGYS